MLVVDASVLVVALADDGMDGDAARARLRGEDLVAPELLDLEVASVLRAPHLPLLQRCWELRESLTIYDAAYVALAEALGVPLVTGDRRLSRAPGPRCQIELLRPAS